MPTAPVPVRVFLVSDFPLLLWGLERLLTSEPDRVLLAGSANSFDEAMHSRALAGADLLLVDLETEGGEFEKILPRLLVRQGLRVLLLTRHADAEQEDRSIVAGAHGVVRKSSSPELLLNAIEKVHAGQLWLDREATARIFHELSRRTGQPSAASAAIVRHDALTEREREVIACVVRHSGAPGRVVALKMHIGESTLRNHLSSIYNKLGVANRHGLVAYALKNGLSEA